MQKSKLHRLLLRWSLKNYPISLVDGIWCYNSKIENFCYIGVAMENHKFRMLSFKFIPKKFKRQNFSKKSLNHIFLATFCPNMVKNKSLPETGLH